MRQIHPFAIKITELELQDKLLEIGPLTEINGETFSIEELPTRPYEKNDNVHVRISFERNLNKIKLERTAYGILDMLGHVGGLFEALQVLCGFLVGIL